MGRIELKLITFYETIKYPLIKIIYIYIILPNNVYLLGWKDLNLRVTESKSVALPLGDTPRKIIKV